MSHSYPSQREQFGILPTLDTKPRTVDLYDVFCGELYLLKSGCQCRMLPTDFPNWRTCYKSLRCGSGLARVRIPFWSKSYRLARPDKEWTQRATSFCIVDSQPSRTRTAGHKGYDAVWKVSGIKPSLRWNARIAPCDTRDYPPSSPTGPGLWPKLTGAESASVKCRTCWSTWVTPESPLPLRCSRPVGSRGGSGETQRTARPSWCFQSDGWWSGLSPGWKSAADSGRTAKGSSIPACDHRWCLTSRC